MLNDIEMAALAKSKFNRDAIGSGSHAVDLLVKSLLTGEQVRVSGTANVGDDYSRLATCKIQWKRVMAALCDKSGFVGERIVRMVLDAIGDAMSENEDVKGKLDEICRRFDEAEETVNRQMSASLPQMECKGPVTWKLTTKEVKNAETVAA